jgi:hypothetical protein
MAGIVVLWVLAPGVSFDILSLGMATVMLSVAAVLGTPRRAKGRKP